MSRIFSSSHVIFYLDIEQIPNIIRDYTNFPLISSNSIIYNIGIIYHNTITNDTEFQSFFTNNLDNCYENKIVKKLSDYISEKANGGKYHVVHWGKAEINFLKKVETKCQHELFDYSPFFDLCDFFIKNKINFSNMKNFKLKEVANSIEDFKKNNVIPTQIHYYKNGLYINKNKYSQSKLQTISDGMETIGLFLLNRNDTILHESIMYYNQKDCEYLYNILNYLFFSKLNV
jgi:hypothetical protein